jgi:hypothetical protein
MLTELFIACFGLREILDKIRGLWSIMNYCALECFIKKLSLTKLRYSGFRERYSIIERVIITSHVCVPIVYPSLTLISPFDLLLQQNHDKTYSFALSVIKKVKLVDTLRALRFLGARISESQIKALNSTKVFSMYGSAYLIDSKNAFFFSYVIR